MVLVSLIAVGQKLVGSDYKPDPGCLRLMRLGHLPGYLVNFMQFQPIGKVKLKYNFVMKKIRCLNSWRRKMFKGAKDISKKKIKETGCAIPDINT